MTELEALIAEQAKDDTYRVYSTSIDAWPKNGADTPPTRLHVTDPRHGTLSMAKRYGCTCPKCRATSAAYQREYNRRKGTKTYFVCACCGSTDVRRERRDG